MRIIGKCSCGSDLYEGIAHHCPTYVISNVNMPAATGREKPSNLQAEPSYPSHETVVMSMRSPDWTIHRKTTRCEKDWPHETKGCGEWVPAATQEPAGSGGTDSVFLSELRDAVLLVPNMLNELGDLDDSGGEPEYAHEHPLKNIVSNVKAHCLGVCISIDEKLAGSLRKVGEDGAIIECALRNAITKMEGWDSEMFDAEIAECKAALEVLARPSSVPVGEQKQEEGV